MGILIGMDEAGYGPNLGPLVVAATAWEVRSQEPGARSEFSPRLRRGSGSSSQAAVASTLLPQTDEVDLYTLLDELVSRSPAADRLAIADSKALYHSGMGLSALERGVHAALGALHRPAASWSAIVKLLAADPNNFQRDLPWHAGFNCELPIDAAADELLQLGARLSATCSAAGARLVAMRARLVYPAEFNELSERFGSKGAALSHVTIGLLRELMSALLEAPFTAAEAASPRTSVFAVCDKHGGRNQYQGLLQHFFPNPWIETLLESRAESRYHWELGDARVGVAFRQGGESFLPAALASMTAKYLRELAMRAWNAFWCQHVPGLRPTAGYPLDARRFKADIAAAQCALGINDHILWRNR